MATGRRPKPTKLRIVGGNAGHRPLNQNEPEPQGELSEPPVWMTEGQKASWRYAIEHAPDGLLRMLDAGVFATWVVAESVHREAALCIAVDGMVLKQGVKVYSKTHPQAGEPIPDTSYLATHPALTIMNQQAAIMLRAAAELGFSPASRSRISLPDKPKSRGGFSDFGPKP